MNELVHLDAVLALTDFEAAVAEDGNPHPPHVSSSPRALRSAVHCFSCLLD